MGGNLAQVVDYRNLIRIRDFVARHDPETVRIEGDHVLAAVYCSTDPARTEVYAGPFCEMTELRTMSEARDWLGY